MSKQLTRIDSIKGQYSADRLAVLWHTGMDDALLDDFMVDTGLAWLRQYTGLPTSVLDDVRLGAYRSMHQQVFNEESFFYADMAKGFEWVREQLKKEERI